MIENSASPLAEATAPITAVEVEISPATGACDHLRAAFGQRQPGQILPGGDGIAGLGQDFRDLQPRPLGAHHGLLARDDDAGNLDDRRKAELRRLQHRDRRALRAGRRARRRRGRGRRGRGGRRRGGRGSFREGLGEAKGFIGIPVRFSGISISEGGRTSQATSKIGYKDIRVSGKFRSRDYLGWIKLDIQMQSGGRRPLQA